MEKIKVKTFVMNSQNPLHHERLDNSINNFIESNDIEVIDVKYSTSVTTGSNGHHYWYPSAMLIYKTK
jgi:hypothetical protein